MTMSPQDIQELPAEMRESFQHLFDTLLVVDPRRRPAEYIQARGRIRYLALRARHHGLGDDVFRSLLLADHVIDRMLGRFAVPS
jgi:hypothetical protein